MTHFTAFDGTDLAYRRAGAGELLVCIPGGPLLAAEYLGDLGGLSRSAELILLDHRGSGASGTPSSVETYRCDRVVQDVEALRLHVGADRLALLGHSAGANVVLRYAEHHPDRVSRLVLIAPSTRAVGIDISKEARSSVAQSRAGEAWYRTAAAALARIQAGSATRAALAALDVPARVVAGGLDINSPPAVMAEVAGLFRRGELLVHEGAGHYPWLDDPVRFRELLQSTALPG